MDLSVLMDSLTSFIKNIIDQLGAFLDEFLGIQLF